MKINVKSLFLIGLMFTSIVKSEITTLEMGVEKPGKSMLKMLKANKLSTDSQCSFSFEDIVDSRQNKITVAHVRTSFSADELEPWMQRVKAQYFDDLQRSSSVIEVLVKPRLTRLYAAPQSMNIHGVAASILDFEVNGDVVLQKHYRGFYAKTNWANGDGEYATALNYALNGLLTNVSVDLNAVCTELSDEK